MIDVPQWVSDEEVSNLANGTCHRRGSVAGPVNRRTEVCFCAAASWLGVAGSAAAARVVPEGAKAIKHRLAAMTASKDLVSQSVRMMYLPWS
jgi:hypothetical protein